LLRYPNLSEEETQKLGTLFGLKTGNARHLQEHLTAIREWVVEGRVATGLLADFLPEIESEFRKAA
jgi:hypothetical protein